MTAVESCPTAACIPVLDRVVDSNERVIDPNDDEMCHSYILPDWLVEHVAEPAMRDELLRQYVLMRTTRNGDCFFHCIHLGLLSIVGPHRAHTSHELRHIVADTMLDERNDAAQSALLGWYQILRAAAASSDFCPSVVNEYRHALPLLDDPDARRGADADTFRFGADVRRRVHDQMMKVATYWGDEYAAGVLKRRLGVDLRILLRTSAGRTRPDIARGQIGYGLNEGVSEWTIVLALEANHYMPLALRRQAQPPRAAKRSKPSGLSGGGSRSAPQYEYQVAFRRVPSFVLDAYRSAGPQRAQSE